MNCEKRYREVDSNLEKSWFSANKEPYDEDIFRIEKLKDLLEDISVEENIKRDREENENNEHENGVIQPGMNSEIENLKVVHEALRNSKISSNNHEDWSKRLFQSMNSLVKLNFRIAIELEETYTQKIFNINGLNALKGVDLDRFLKLTEMNDQFSENEKYCFSIACSSFTPCDFITGHSLNRVFIWFDTEGIPYAMDEDKKINLEIFNEIMHISSNEPFIKNLNSLESWRRNPKRIVKRNEEYFKNLLVMVPKNFEKNLFIQLDTKSYIRSTYKALLCDIDANFNEACENLEFIVRELSKCGSKSDLSLEYEFIYNIIESIKYIQDDELMKNFLNTALIKEIYCSNDRNNEIVDDLVNLIKEFGAETLKDALFKLMKGCKLFERNCELVIAMLKRDEKDVAYDCLINFVIPLMKDVKYHSHYYDDSYKNLRKCENFISLISAFKDSKTSNRELLDRHLSMLILDPCLKNIHFNAEIAAMLYINELYENTEKCIKTGILPAFKEDFHSLTDDYHNISLCIKTLIEKLPRYLCAVDQICQKLIQSRLFNKQLSNKNALIDNFIQDMIKSSRRVTDNTSIQMILKYRLNFYMNKLKEIYKANNTWIMPFAEVPGHPKVENFLKSNKQSLKYDKVFKNKNLARGFAFKLNSLKETYSVQVELHGTDVNPYVIINKTKAYSKTFDSLKSTYELITSKIQSLLLE